MKKRLKISIRGSLVFPPMFLQILYFFNSFTPCPFDGHPNQGQTVDLFQNREGKITKLKKNKGKITIRLLDRGNNTIFPIN